jgi:hypothetical protein
MYTTGAVDKYVSTITRLPTPALIFYAITAEKQSEYSLSTK